MIRKGIRSADVILNYTDPIPAELACYLKEGKCIALVGAGVSQRCISRTRRPLPGWNELLSDILEWAKGTKVVNIATAKDLIELIQRGEYLLVAEELREKVGSENLAKFVIEKFDPDSIVPARVHDLIVALPFRTIVTTNYDNLLERAYNRVWNRQLECFSVINKFTPNKITNHGQSLLKLHGDIAYPESIVLAHRDYIELIADKAYSKLLRIMFSQHSALMIGYSLSDPDVQLSLDLLRYSGSNMEHFLLCKKGTRNMTEKHRLHVDRNIRVIEYVDYFGFHNHIETFLEGLIFEIGKQDVLERVRMPIRRRIQVHYSFKRKSDGEFIWNYIFREGAITLGSGAQHIQLKTLEKSLDTGLRAIDYLLFVIDDDTKSDNRLWNLLIAARKKSVQAGVQIILMIIGSSARPLFLRKTFAANPTFFLPEGFGETHLEEFRQYIAQDMKGGFRQR